MVGTRNGVQRSCEFNNKMNSDISLLEDLIKSSNFNDLLGEEVLSTLRCPVCMDYFNEPTVLMCGHTFCYGCLYDMSMHTKSRMMNVHIKNIRIHCPNCRVPVHVQSILQRRCTTNFTVASFLESLRDVKVPVKTFAEASTNTDNKEEENAEDETEYEYDEELLNKINNELDTALSIQHGQTVIHDAWREIHKLREDCDMFTDLSFGDDKSERSEGEEKIKAKIVSPEDSISSLLNNSLQREDPAILRSSISTWQSGTSCSKHR